MCNNLILFSLIGSLKKEPGILTKIGTGQRLGGGQDRFV